MIKILFIIIGGIHGLIHIMGFIKAFKPEAIEQLKMPISKPLGIIWLTTCILMLLSLALFVFDNNSWMYIGIISVIFSQLLIFKSWGDAKFGSIANLLFVVFIVLWYFGKV